VLAAAVRTLAASVAAGLAAVGVATLLDGSPSVVRGLVAAPAGAAVYLLAGRLLGLAEVAAVIGRLRRNGRA
jgi:hypothetical protein